MEGVEVRIVPNQDSVTLRITPTTSPMQSPRPTAVASSPADGNGASASPLSGSTHSFEHLSNQFGQPSSPTAASEAEADAVPSPPSLPDLEALNPDADGDGPLQGSSDGGLTGAGNVSAAAPSTDGGDGSEAGLEASFAEQLQLTADLHRGSMPSMAFSAVSGAAAGSEPPSEAASPLGSSYSDLADASASQPVLQQALAQFGVRCKGLFLQRCSCVGHTLCHSL